MNLLIDAKTKAKKLSKEKGIKLKDALEMVANENKYKDWKSYKNFLDTFWYQNGSAFLNHWFVLHAEAKGFRDENGGYLLTYKGQYFVVERGYIEHMGLDPDDKVWASIGFDASSSDALEKLYKYLKGFNKSESSEI